MPDHACTKHEPGTPSCYSTHQCRCVPCSRAGRRQRKVSRLGLSDLVNAAPVRAHITRLLDRGHSTSGIAIAAGLSGAQITYTLTRARRIHPETARSIMSVRTPAGYVDSTGTRRRLQALAALGWSFAGMARRLGLSDATVHHWTAGRRVEAVSAAKARRLYAELWDQRPPESTPIQRMVANRNRALAQRRGWPPPMAWDDETIDRPESAPADLRTPRHTTPTETLVEAAELGCCLAELCSRFNLKASSVERSLDRVGRHDLWVRIRPADMSDPRTRKAA